MCLGSTTTCNYSITPLNSIQWLSSNTSKPHVFLELEGPICGVTLFSVDRILASLLYEVFFLKMDLVFVFVFKKQIKNIFLYTFQK